MRRRGAARMPRGVMRNPIAREALKPGRQKQAAPNINVMRFRCDEPKAKLRHAFFMRQEQAFSRPMRDGKKNAAATVWRKNFRRFATRR
jgi:division protein CdvB (Snf7/Vps24/ESCRT-III family)